MRHYSEEAVTDAVERNIPATVEDRFFHVVVLDPTAHDFFVWGLDRDDAAQRVDMYLRHRGLPGCVCTPTQIEPFDFRGEGEAWGMTRAEQDRIFGAA